MSESVGIEVQYNDMSHSTNATSTAFKASSPNRTHILNIMLNPERNVLTSPNLVLLPPPMFVSFEICIATCAHPDTSSVHSAQIRIGKLHRLPPRFSSMLDIAGSG